MRCSSDPLPVHAPEELVYLYRIQKDGRSFVTDHRDVEFFKGHYDQVFSSITAHWNMGVVLSADDGADRVRGEFVTASYFDVLGVRPLHGRAFRPEEDDVTNTQLAIVISYDLWTRRFQRDPAILGKQIRLNDKVFSVVGVIGPEFTGLSGPWLPSNFWVVWAQYDPLRYWGSGTGVIGRLKPGVSLEQARAVVTVQSAQLRREWVERMGESARGWNPDPSLVLPASDVRMPLDPSKAVIPPKLVSAVIVVVAIVLLIAAANIAGVLAARGVARTSELAVRRALGAAAPRLVRQLLAESVVLSAAGGAAGLFVAWLGVRLYQAWTPARFVIDVPLDVRVVAFTAALCVCAGLLVGLAPAVQALKVNVIAALAGAGAGGGPTGRMRRRLRHAIVIPQVALSVVLLVVAGVHVRTLLQVEQADFGYRLEDRVVFGVGHWDTNPPPDPLGNGVEARTKQAARDRAFYRAVFDRVKALPGADGVAMTTTLPVNSWAPPRTYISQATFLAGGTDPWSAWDATVSAGYFKTMGMALKFGRDFDERDALTSPKVAIVSESFAKRLWPSGDAVGQSLSLYAAGNSGQKVEWLEVVGVVNETDPILKDTGDRPVVYTPLTQSWDPSGPFIVAWARGNQTAFTQGVKNAVTGADPFAQVFSVQSMEQIAGELLYPRRAAAGILVACGMVGLLLASIGLYGVVSYSVAQRLREIGIRSTLGADRRHILALVVREGATVAATGALPGLGLSLLALRLTSNLVGAVPTFDLVMFLAVPFGTMVVVLLASYFPARRAAHVDPMTVLRGL